MSTRRFVLADLPAQPWKNQGGATREILSWPPGADLDGFAWRVSVAGIASDGPFSTFPGVDRTILLLRGSGIRLRGDGIDHRLDSPGVPFDFDGAVPVDCTLLDGACEVLNVMARHDRGRVRLEIVTGPNSLHATSALLISVRGDWQIGAEHLSAGAGMCWADAPHDWRIRPSSADGRLVIIHWEPR